MRASALLLSGSAIALLAGCALAPAPEQKDIQAEALPHVQVPAAFTVAGATSGTVRETWIDDFNDPQLKALVEEALQYNTDLRLATARVQLAAAQAKLAGAAIYPAVNALAHGGGKFGGDGSGVSAVGLFANWEIDLWGRVRYERESGRLGYDAAALDAEYARQSIAALVAKSWLLAISAGVQLGIAQDIVRSSDQFTGLAQDRLRVGRGDEYDLSLAQANYETVRDAARQLALGRDQALRALETLVGRYPAGVVDVPRALPPVPAPIPVGLPSELLERRPDVVAAERRVAAAFNRVGEARAARLPKIGLTASVSSVSSELFVLKDHSNPTFSLGANIVAPLFNGYALESQVDIRTAEQAMAVAEYGRIGARAFGEVETALLASFAADDREDILARAVDHNSRTLELANVRFKVGSGDLRAVLQQSVALLAVQTSLVQVQTERRLQRVNLHLALGGGFTDTPPTAAVDRNGTARAELRGAQ